MTHRSHSQRPFPYETKSLIGRIINMQTNMLEIKKKQVEHEN